MRNSSDIFNLKELKDGDTNGTQTFSVNGSCQLTKFCRRRNLHAGSFTFKYGSSSSYKIPTDLTEVHKGIGDYADCDDDNLEDIKKGLGEPKSSRLEEAVFADTLEICDEKKTPQKKTLISSTTSNPIKKKSPAFRKLTPKEDEKVSESAMSRNPLTGAGMATETHRKSNKEPAKTPKWVW